MKEYLTSKVSSAWQTSHCLVFYPSQCSKTKPGTTTSWKSPTSHWFLTGVQAHLIPSALSGWFGHLWEKAFKGFLERATAAFTSSLHAVYQSIGDLLKEVRQRTVSFLLTQLIAREKDVKGLPEQEDGKVIVASVWWVREKEAIKTEKKPPPRGEGPQWQTAHLHPAQVRC